MCSRQESMPSDGCVIMWSFIIFTSKLCSESSSVVSQNEGYCELISYQNPQRNRPSGWRWAACPCKQFDWSGVTFLEATNLRLYVWGFKWYKKTGKTLIKLTSHIFGISPTCPWNTEEELECIIQIGVRKGLRFSVVSSK